LQRDQDGSRERPLQLLCKQGMTSALIVGHVEGGDVSYTEQGGLAFGVDMKQNGIRMAQQLKMGVCHPLGWETGQGCRAEVARHQCTGLRPGQR
jgi:hypothetical protein